MFRGFYNLTSEIICQNKNLNVISNNMANVSTPGYKGDTLVTSTFRDELLYRSGSPEPIGETSMGKAGVGNVTGFTQGALYNTGGVLDVALTGEGFFKVQTGEGMVYTRDGAFSIDAEGFLSLQGIGRVMGSQGPIRMRTDDVSIDSRGNIYEAGNTEPSGKISIADFQDYGLLQKQDNGMFTTIQPELNSDTVMQWKYLETSNVDTMTEMTQMMGSQRSIQSSAQVLKMYDQLMGKIVSEIGRI
ncbi:flagellar hook-basal body protein [Parasporobacterium paucivorans]|uniref:Flagellar basal-body rod protein FlgG n=1 Tax=Parasporobacterium paucivorans DSM 15970 TaxID=1122934 RepID=A0A1M6IA02_9FIRM|nr:flagellar hook-basal body complex protein [Parasporobacterium paucivorans]SHJ31252.1 flagellar basal-body rod protein FlgG [Parasporobacterium paucivorans DSM 15970]